MKRKAAEEQKDKQRSLRRAFAAGVLAGRDLAKEEGEVDDDELGDVDAEDEDDDE